MKKVLLFILALAAPAMADINVTQGSGKTVHTDTVNGLEYQAVKIIDGTTGGTSSMTVTSNGAAKVDGSAVTQPVSIVNPSLGVYTVTNTTNPLVFQSTSTIPVGGPAASGASPVGNPLQNGGLAATALPTAVSGAQMVAAMKDKFGRDVVINNCPRDLLISTAVTLSGSTAETVLLSSGAASVFDDLHLLLVNNTSATASRIDFRSNGNGTTVDFPIYVPAGDMRGLTSVVYWPQGTSAANWTVQSSASVTDIRIAAVFCKDK